MPRPAMPTVLATAALLGSVTPGRAELLYFRNGGHVQAPAAVEGDRVRVMTPVGSVVFRAEDFHKIAPGGCPEREWEPRRRAALGGGAPARFAAAWWALENGLVREAAGMLREAHQVDPRHAPAARLVDVLDRLDRPRDDPDTEPLRRALGVPCQEARGRTVLLLHQHSDADASARLELLERVTLAYYLLLAGHGVEVDVPAHRLVSVYLRDRADYLAFLRSQHAGAFQSTLGYYHPTFRAVVAFDARSPGKSSADAQEDDLPADDPTLRDARRRRLLSRLDGLARDHGTAAHEMVHLLVTESGLEPRPGAFPYWLHEGLAAQFEVVRGGRWAGVGRAHDLRLPDLRAALPAADLAALVRDEGFGHGYRGDLYARCWGLVYFLRKSHPREFHALLDLLRAPEAAGGPGPVPRVERWLRTEFGPDPVALEAEWRSFLAGIRTPLEEEAPSADRAGVDPRRTGG